MNRFVNRLEAGLQRMAQPAQEGKIRDKQKVERRIGRLLEWYGRTAPLFEVSVEERGSGKEASLTIHTCKREERHAWVTRTVGSYLLRTN